MQFGHIDGTPLMECSTATVANALRDINSGMYRLIGTPADINSWRERLEIELLRRNLGL